MVKNDSSASAGLAQLVDVDHMLDEPETSYHQPVTGERPETFGEAWLSFIEYGTFPWAFSAPDVEVA